MFNRQITVFYNDLIVIYVVSYLINTAKFLQVNTLIAFQAWQLFYVDKRRTDDILHFFRSSK